MMGYSGCKSLLDSHPPGDGSMSRLSVSENAKAIRRIHLKCWAIYPLIRVTGVRVRANRSGGVMVLGPISDAGVKRSALANRHPLRMRLPISEFGWKTSFGNGPAS